MTWALALLAWVGLAVGERRWATTHPQTPRMIGAGGNLRVEVPLADRLGPVAITAPALASVAWVLFLGAPGSWLAVVLWPVLSLFVALALYAFSRRSVELRIDAETRRLTGEGLDLPLGEVCGIRAEQDSLVIEHTTGTERVRCPGVDPADLPPCARELWSTARKHGADPQARRLRDEARRAMHEAGISTSEQ
ncbi:MAG: hypothetical protein EP330_00685 [Deltaproteobacteria bacterium]|nr:MAG: hypothetical protein EP330_00685 [Deltaproteobacteria bacterium]